jgi:hypothetical protein
MVLGVLALVKWGVRGVDAVVGGDSTTALSWVEKEKVSGKAAMNAALVLVSLCIKFGIGYGGPLEQTSGVDDSAEDWLLGAEKVGELGSFVRLSVTEGTMRKYRYGGIDWCEYVSSQRRSDYYMKSANRESKVVEGVSLELWYGVVWKQKCYR